MNGDNINVVADLEINYQGAIRTQVLATPGPNLAHLMWAVYERVGENEGSKLNWTRSRRLALATTELVEAENPDPVALGSDDIVTDLMELGQYFAVSSKVIKRRPWRITDTHIPLLARNWSETLDKLAQLTLVGGSNIYNSDGVATLAEIDTKALEDDFNAIDRALASAYAEPLTEYVLPSDGIGTEAIQPCAVVICGPDMRTDIEAWTNFKGIETYSAGTQIIPGEFGKYRRFRFVMSQLADEGTLVGSSPVGSGLQDTGGDTKVFQAVVLTREVYGVVDFGSFQSHASIGYSAPGKQTDVLKRASAFGWSHDWGCTILDDTRMVVYRAGASA